MGDRTPDYLAVPLALERSNWKGRHQIYVPYPSTLYSSTGIDMLCPDFTKTSMFTKASH